MLWYIKQLLPLAYESRYVEVESGVARHLRWRMWFGRSFAVRDVVS